MGFGDVNPDEGFDDVGTMVGYADFTVLLWDVGFDDAVIFVGFGDVNPDEGLDDVGTMLGFDDVNDAVGFDDMLSAKFVWSFGSVVCFPDLLDGTECVGLRDTGDSATDGADESLTDGCAIGICAVGFDDFVDERGVGFDDVVTGSEVAVGLDDFRSDERDGFGEPISTVGEAVGFDDFPSNRIMEGSKRLDVFLSDGIIIIKPVCLSFFFSAKELSVINTRPRRVAILIAEIIMKHVYVVTAEYGLQCCFVSVC